MSRQGAKGQVTARIWIVDAREATHGNGNCNNRQGRWNRIRSKSPRTKLTSYTYTLVKGRNDVADVAWGLGFLLLAWTSFFLSRASETRGILVGILVSVGLLPLSTATTGFADFGSGGLWEC